MPGYNTRDATLTLIAPHFRQTQPMNGCFDAAKKEIDGGGRAGRRWGRWGGGQRSTIYQHIKHLQMNEVEQLMTCTRSVLAQCPWKWLHQGGLNILWSHVKHSFLVLIFCDPYTKPWQSDCTLPPMGDRFYSSLSQLLPIRKLKLF